MKEIDMVTAYYDCQECGAIAGYEPPPCWQCGSNHAVLRPLDAAIYSTHRLRLRKLGDIEKQRDDLLAACEARELVLEHYKHCVACMHNEQCDVGFNLGVNEHGLRIAALEKARGEQ